MKRSYLLLFLIVLLASVLRFWGVDRIPPSLTWDEVSWGYNAYSLGIDGRDEFGRFLPYDYLESFGDFKPPLYVYLAIVPVKIFGLNEFATRFPSALFGSLTVLLTFFLVKSIFFASKKGEKYAFVASGLLAISPWHIMLSRAAFEANIATCFLILGVFLFLKSIQEKPHWLIFSSIVFAASFYTFNTSRIVAPLLVIMLVIGMRKELLKIKKYVVVAGIIGVVLFLPIVNFLFSPQASLRFREVNIFSDISIIERLNKQVDNDSNIWWSKILHNRRFAYLAEYTNHYFDNLTPDFLFIKGDGNPKFSTQQVGQLYLWEAPFLIAGILLLFRKREGKWWIIPLWLLLGIIPAATARETPHALRIETTMPTFQIFVAYAVVAFFGAIHRFKHVMLAIFAGVVFLNFLYFLHDYIVHYPFDYSHEWQFGYKESIAYVESNKEKFDEIRVTEALGRPYMYYLFYTKTDPRIFRKTAKVSRDVFGFVHVHSFGKYNFSEDVHTKAGKNKKILYINKPQQIPGNATILKKFNLVDGTTTLVAYTL